MARGSWGKSSEITFSQGDSFRERSHGHHQAEGGKPCALGNRCYERDYEGNPKPGPRAFCESDRRWVERAIASLPEDFTRLSFLLARAQQEEERVSGSKDPGLPLAADTDAFMREIVYIALSWEIEVRCVNRLSDIPEDHRRMGVELATASRILARHFDTLIALPARDMRRYAPPKRVRELACEAERAERDGEDVPEVYVRWDASGDAWEYVTMDGTTAALELLGLHGRARGMLGLSPQRRRITEVPCDECKAKTLIQREAASGGWVPAVSCTNCPNSYTGARYDLLMGRVYQVQLQALKAEETRRRGAGAAA